MNPDFDLLERTLARVEKLAERDYYEDATHPGIYYPALVNESGAPHDLGADSWWQEDWRCGTGMCFYGHGAEEAGYPWATGPNSGKLSALVVVPPDQGEAIINYGRALGSHHADLWSQRPDGSYVMHVSLVMGWRFGRLGYGAHIELSHESNNIADLRAVIADWRGHFATVTEHNNPHP